MFWTASTAFSVFWFLDGFSPQEPEAGDGRVGGERNQGACSLALSLPWPQTDGGCVPLLKPQLLPGRPFSQLWFSF